MASQFHLTDEDREMALSALDAMIDYGAPHDMLPDIKTAQTRLLHYAPAMTGRDVALICAGLQLLVEENPLDYKANQLLTRIRALVPHDSSQK